jgi:large subunit ribosomal protein L24
MKLHKGDKVKVISGKYKGKIGAILKVLVTENRVLVDGINLVKRHVKPGTVSKEGGIVTIEKPISVANVMFLDEKTNAPVRLGSKIIDDKKYRINKKSGDVVEKKLK